MKKITFALVLALVPTLAFADVLPGADPVLAWLASPPVLISGIVGVVLEFVLRLWPSKNPLSVLHLIGAVVSKIGQICSAVGSFLDKVLPQNITPPSV